MSSPWNWESVLHAGPRISAPLLLTVCGDELWRKDNIYSLVHDDRHGVVED
jgi:hypothetical protein